MPEKKNETPRERAGGGWLRKGVLYGLLIGAIFAVILFVGKSIGGTPITSPYVEFYGERCGHCARMEPIVGEVERELGINFSKLEITTNLANEGVFLRFKDSIRKQCDFLGTPTFYNLDTGSALCGEVDKETLKAWVLNQTNASAGGSAGGVS